MNTNDNVFTGIANATGIIDRGGDVIAPGAFRPAIPGFLERGFISRSHDWESLPVAMPISAKERPRPPDPICGHNSSMDAIRDYCLSLPEAYEDHPWGEVAFKVNKKIFATFGVPGDKFNLTLKLPFSHWPAQQLPFVKPTGYNLGKSGWVTATFATGDDVPTEMLEAWIRESYRAVAPKKLAALVPEPA
jgi:predicted DNA-binding protein (MmcQ/YjbR family)